MPLAYVDVSRNPKYLATCPHCGGRVETAYNLVASGVFDALAKYVPPLLVTIHVCEAAARRRRRRGAIATTAALAAIAIVPFIALEIGTRGYVKSGIALGIAAGVVAIAVRAGWPARLLDWTTLGVSVSRVRSFERIVRFTFRSDQYFAEWVATNPPVAAGRRPRVSRTEPFAENPIVRTRLTPAVVALVVAVILALHHWYASRGHVPFTGTVSFLGAAGALAAGGLIYPPAFWSLSSYGRRLSPPIRVIGIVFAAAGGVAGFLLAMSYRR